MVADLSSDSVLSMLPSSGTTGYKLKQGLFDLSTVIEAISVFSFSTAAQLSSTLSLLLPALSTETTSEQWILKNVPKYRVLILQSNLMKVIFFLLKL